MRGNWGSDHIVRSGCGVHHGLSARIILGHLSWGQRWTGFGDIGEKRLSRGHECLVGSFESANSFNVLFHFSLHARNWRLSVRDPVHAESPPTIAIKRALPVGHNGLEESGDRVCPLGSYISTATLRTGYSKKTYLIAFCQTLRHSLTPRAQGHVALLRSGQSCMHIKECMLEIHKSSFGRIGHGFGRCTGMRDSGLVSGERVAVDQSMS